MAYLHRHRKLFSDDGSEITDPSIKDMDSCIKFCVNTKENSTLPCYLCSESCVNLCENTIIPPPLPPPEHKTKHLSPYLIVTFSVLAAAVLIVFGYALYMWFYKRRRQARDQVNQAHDHFLDEDQGPVIDHPIWYIQTVGLQPSVINSITVCKYKPDDGLVEGTECSVCLSEFEEDETLRLLPKCSHAFHIPCIDTWLRSHTNCPMCRAPIVINVGRSSDPEPVIESLEHPSEEVSTRIPENIGESSREINSASSQPENGDGVVTSSAIDVGDGAKRDGMILGDETDDLQPKRRSVSMDSLSALNISLSIANNFPGESERNLNSELEKEHQKVIDIVTKKDGECQGLMGLMGSSSSSIGKSLASGSSNMRRSLSCSGRFLFLPMSGRSQRSVLPL